MTERMEETERLESRIRVLESAVADLGDRAAIQDLRFHYHVAVNEKELDSIHLLFAEDAVIDPDRKKDIVQQVIQTFFDAYLKQDARALERLRKSGDEFSEVKLVSEE